MNTSGSFSSSSSTTVAQPPPFTVSQWHELEHQALIFKYLKAGLPVPPDLLVPIRRSLQLISSSLLHHPNCKQLTNINVCLFFSNKDQILYVFSRLLDGSCKFIGFQWDFLLKLVVKFWYCSRVLFLLWEENRPGAGPVPKDGWQEVEVLQGCTSGLQVLWAAHEPKPLPFKKACGITKWLSAALVSWEQQWQWRWRRRRKLPEPTTCGLRQ